ncbi:MAG: hypothetical protein ACRC4N_07050 [Gammaproteobacteria bacterium]
MSESVCVCVCACVCVRVHPLNHSNELLTEFTHAGVRHKIVYALIYGF